MRQPCCVVLYCVLCLLQRASVEVGGVRLESKEVGRVLEPA
jgi:hypothetical protein